jgi:hypothetical protein
LLVPFNVMRPLTAADFYHDAAARLWAGKVN